MPSLACTSAWGTRQSARAQGEVRGRASARFVGERAPLHIKEQLVAHRSPLRDDEVRRDGQECPSRHTTSFFRSASQTRAACLHADALCWPAVPAVSAAMLSVWAGTVEQSASPFSASTVLWIAQTAPEGADDDTGDRRQAEGAATCAMWLSLSGPGVDLNGGDGGALRCR